ncbi:hypothetical protein [Corynebacterium sp. 335C]
MTVHDDHAPDGGARGRAHAGDDGPLRDPRIATHLGEVERDSGKLRGLRTRRARRGLVIALGAVFALMALSIVALGVASAGGGGRAWATAGIVGYPAGVVLLIVVGTMLGIVTDHMADAPLALLDEYERAQVEGIRALAYQLFTWLVTALAAIMVCAGTWALVNEPDWAPAAAYLSGTTLLLVALVMQRVPDAYIAWTRPDD